MKRFVLLSIVTPALVLGGCQTLPQQAPVATDSSVPDPAPVARLWVKGMACPY